MKVRVTYRPKRTLIWDLENRPSAYWYQGETTSEITAFGWKWQDEDEIHTLVLVAGGRFERDDGKRISDRRAYEHFAAEVGRADLQVGHNLLRHDLPMLSAGLLRRQLPPLERVRVSDTLRHYIRRGGMSASLESLTSMYGLEGEKLRMTTPMWEQANRLSSDGVALARERVSSDVLLQQRLRDRMLELNVLRAPQWWTP